MNASPAPTPKPQPQPASAVPAPQPARNDSGIDQVFRWCVGIFLVSTATLVAFAVYAVVTRQVGIYLHAVGVIYLLLSLGFLAIVAVVFVQSHFVSSKEVEAPKLELFELDQRV